MPPALAEGDRRTADVNRVSGGIGSWLASHPRLIAAGADLALVTLVAELAAALAKINFWMTLASVALLYNTISVALLGCSPSVWAVYTYVSSRRPAAPRPADKAAFRRLGGLMRNSDPAPERDTAS